MKLQVRHHSVYRYQEAVSTSHHEARLAPRRGEGQTVLSHETVVSPAPVYTHERLDFFGNRTLHFHLHHPHKQLDVVATSLVEVLPATPGPDPSPPWEMVRDRLRADRTPSVREALGFSLDSPLAGAHPEAAAYALGSFSPGRPLLEAVRDLTSRIHADFRYDPQATEISTPVKEVLSSRAGVCQDFAHLGIACLRAMGLGARYVSGYLLTRPPPGKPKLVGADASHAWLGVFVPDAGWFDFDPTNDLEPGEEHVRVAYGRDFGDVTPLKGVIFGGGPHEVTVAVDVQAVAVGVGGP